MLSRKDNQLIRVAAWINFLLLLLAVSIFLLLWNNPDTNAEAATRKITSFVLANAICWVVNVSLLMFFEPVIARWIKNKLITFYLPSFLIVFSLALIIPRTSLLALFTNKPLTSSVFSPLFFVTSVNTLCVVIIELILSRYNESTVKLEVSELKMKSLQAQHEKLKNQLHPHFLFNSLNALKSLIKRDPDLAENYLIKLSDFLRFSISHSEQNVVSLEQELKFSTDYLEMQKVRFRHAISYSIDIPLLQMNAKLPVFSLQLVLENAIKHNKLTQEEPLAITMAYLEPDWLLIENNINPKTQTEPGSGTGLKNLSDRYLLLINEGIKIQHHHDLFQVYLKLIKE
jgi:hypothetical protein